MRRFLMYGGLAAILGVLYVAGVLLYRRMQDSDYTRRNAGTPAPVPQVVQDEGTGVRILQFYTPAAEVAKGASTNICYGVQNARAVQINPPVEQVWPSLSRCFAVSASATTTYRLTAEGNDGRKVSAEFTLKVAKKGS